MKSFLKIIGSLVVTATLAAAPAGAQTADTGGPTATPGSIFDVPPSLTQDGFQQLVADLGSVLRFRQLGDTTTLAKGVVELGVQLANTPFDDAKWTWNASNSNVGRSISFPQVVARFGVADRVDLGLWGGVDPPAKYGMAGIDAKVALLRQGPGRPVSVSVRPSVTSLIRPGNMWAGTTSVDLSVSRAFGPWSPYVGVAAASSLGIEWLDEVDLDPATAGRSLAYAGLSYRWRAFILSAEVEKGTRVNYAFRVGRRF